MKNVLARSKEMIQEMVATASTIASARRDLIVGDVMKIIETDYLSEKMRYEELSRTSDDAAREWRAKNEYYATLTSATAGATVWLDSLRMILHC